MTSPVYQQLFQPHSPLLQSKPPPAFQTVNSNEGLCDIFPQTRKKETKQSENKARDIPYPLSSIFSLP